MFVYKKNTLKRTLEPLGQKQAKYILTHEPTSVSIAYVFQVKDYDEGANLTMKNGRVAMTSPFKIYRTKSDGVLSFYEESGSFFGFVSC